MTSQRAYGFEKIETVEVQAWLDENVQRELDMVWIVTDQGDVFARSTLKTETAEGNAEFYKKRGWTDSECCFFKG